MYDSLNYFSEFQNEFLWFYEFIIKTKENVTKNKLFKKIDTRYIKLKWHKYINYELIEKS